MYDIHISPGSDGFEWDDANVEHVARHGLDPADVELALANGALTLQHAVTGSGEKRWVSVGPTGARGNGRLVVVVWTVRGARVRVVTAYPAAKRLQAEYAKAKTGEGRARRADPKVQNGG